MTDYSFYFKQKYRIPSARLKNWDYSSSGWYFVTVCTYQKECWLGTVKNNKLILSEIGKIAEKYWLEIPKHFPFVKVDEYIVMPNHIHGIIIIKNKKYTVETQNFASLQNKNNKNISGSKFGPQSKNLASIIRGFKSTVKKYAIVQRMNFHWQSRFYDHIIRNEHSLNEIRQYIKNNPLKWEEDEENPKNIVKYY